MEDQLRGVYLRSVEEYLDYLYNKNVSEKIELPQSNFFKEKFVIL